MSKDLGDFQTPPLLVENVLQCLAQTGRQWIRALEPTCGRGNFIEGLLRLASSPHEIQGIEIQSKYVEYAQNSVSHPALASVKRANLFDMDLRHDLVWKTSGQAGAHSRGDKQRREVSQSHQNHCQNAHAIAF